MIWMEKVIQRFLLNRVENAGDILGNVCYWFNFYASSKDSEKLCSSV